MTLAHVWSARFVYRYMGVHTMYVYNTVCYLQLVSDAGHHI